MGLLGRGDSLAGGPEEGRMRQPAAWGWGVCAEICPLAFWMKKCQGVGGDESGCVPAG